MTLKKAKKEKLETTIDSIRDRFGFLAVQAVLYQKIQGQLLAVDQSADIPLEDWRFKMIDRSYLPFKVAREYQD